MNPTRAMIDSLTNNVLSAKAYGHKAQANLLLAQERFRHIGMNDENDALFLRAYAQANEISVFNVDTDPSENLELDTDGLKTKTEAAFSRTTELKVSWDGFQPNTQNADIYADGMKLVEEALQDIQTARAHAQTAIVMGRQAVKAQQEAKTAEA